MKFTVDRQKWYRGQGLIGSVLLRSDGKRCCIGFVGQQCGIPDEELRGLDTVDRHSQKNLPESYLKWPGWLRDPCLAFQAYEPNDNPMISEALREEQLKTVFSRYGDEIELMN